MNLLAAAAEAIGGTTRKTEKVRLLADYFRSRTVPEAAISAVFLSGRPFPAWEETTLQVGGALLWQVLKDITEQSDTVLTAAYRRHGDLGCAAYDLLLSVVPPFSRPVLARQGGSESSLNLLDVERSFRGIASVRGPSTTIPRKARCCGRVIVPASEPR